MSEDRLPGRRLLLGTLYAAAAAVFVASAVDGPLFVYSAAPPGAAGDVNGYLAAGPLYTFYVVQLWGTLLAALLLASRTRRRWRPGSAHRAALDLLLTGLAVIIATMAFSTPVIYLDGPLWMESLTYPFLCAGAFLIALAFVRYPGLVEGQLLRADLKSSLLAAAALMTAFTGVILAAGEGFRALAGLGWLVLTVFVLNDDLRTLIDHGFYRQGSRSARSGLRTAAAYAGGGRSLDVSSLAAGEALDVAAYFEELDRAGAAAARLEGAHDPRLELLERAEFAAARGALGLPGEWTCAQGLDATVVTAAVAERLKPRERQALGLKYLGYSDKEMARLMGVRPGVPRSYLGEGKRKLGLSAGAPIMLFVHFARLVELDALPLLADEALRPVSVRPVP